MRVRFWGTRGSIARPGPSTVRYGGNTSCVEVTADDGTWLILDCGTGVHALSLDLRRRGHVPPAGHVLIGHTHWDHIQGFPFFEPLYASDTEWTVYAPGDRADRLEQTFARQMSPEHHPIGLGDLRAKLHFRALAEGCFAIGGFRITAHYLHHPALTLGYRIEADGASLVYASDHEPLTVPGPGAEDWPIHPEDRRHVEFLAGADLVIHDAQYTLAEYRERLGWGHTPVESAVDAAIAAAVRRLALYHHDPDRDDDAVDALVGLATARAAAAGSRLEVFAAAEGGEIELRGGATAPGREPAAPAPHVAAGSQAERSVLLATRDANLALRIAEALRDDGIRLIPLSEPGAVLAAAEKAPPSLLLLDLDAAGADPLAVCRSVRGAADPRLREIPILVVAEAAPSAPAIAAAFAAGATDHLSRPIKPALVRSRIRGWLARSQAARARTAQ